MSRRQKDDDQPPETTQHFVQLCMYAPSVLFVVVIIFMDHV